MKWIGLTGGIATGKSTVAEMIKESGHPVINADEVAHQALRPESPVFAEIVKTFGQDMVGADGAIDRRRLGARIFKDEALRLKLESLVHPFVKRKVRELRSDYEKRGEPAVFYDVPLLYEKNLQNEFDEVIVVWCRPELQLERLIQRNSLSPIEARDRVAAQIPIDEKKRRADHLIDNNSTRDDLRANVTAVLSKITGR